MNTHNWGNYLYKHLKLLSIFILIAVSVCARGQEGKNSANTLVSFSAKSKPLLTILKSIEKQTGFRFNYSNSEIDVKQLLTINQDKVPLDFALSILFTPLNYSWKIIDRSIFIIKRKKNSEETAMAGGSLQDTSFTLTGKVVDADDKPIPGATISLKASGRGTTTSSNGDFKINEVTYGSIILISSIGFETRQVTIKGSSLLVKLNVVVSGLDETVVIAYGTTTKRLTTGNISTVKAKDIGNQPVNNPLLALQGRVPGLFITQNTGVAGGGVTVRLQGINSLGRGSDPLYVIDGVPYSSQLLPNISTDAGILGGNGNTNPSYAPSGGGSPLSFINPADIESIDVLKDADATAIYGSRAANGAILITTKKGRPGKMEVDVNVQKGWGKVTRKLDLLNTEQYLEMRHEAFRNDDASPGATAYDINGTWDTTRYTDWQNELIGGIAHYNYAQASVSGGNSIVNFLISGGYRRESTVFPGNMADQKGSLHFNVNSASLNQKIRIQLTGEYMVDNNRIINTDLTQNAIKLPPNGPALFDADGKLNWAPSANGNSTWINPLAYLNSKYSFKANNLISSLLLSYQVLSGLEVKANLGYTNLQTNETSIKPLSSLAPERRPIESRFSQFTNGRISTWNLEPQITYKRSISKGVLETLVGTTILQSYSNLQHFDASGFNSDLVMEDIRAASSVSVSNSIASTYRYNALFGRVNFNWESKYIVNLTGRRDGSSRFGSRNLFHNFASVSGAWIFTNESFLRSFPCLSFGKLKASYGTTGNDQIGDYQYLNLYDPYSVDLAYQGVVALTPSGLPNPNLQWEETRKLNIGLDIGILKDRVLFNTNYFLNRSSNLLQSYALPIFTGNEQIQVNFPATVQNSGWEFSVQSKNIEGGDFAWTTNFNLTLYKNKLQKFPNLENSSYADFYVVGQPITVRRAFHFLGVDPTTGLYIFEDTHRNSTSVPEFPTDAKVLINTDPKFYGGFQNNFRYKGLELDLLFQFTKQMGVNYDFGTRPGRFSLNVNSGTVIANQPVYVLDRWQKTGDVKTKQRYSAAYPSDILVPFLNANVSDASFSDASYIRLKNISLAWSMPDAWKRRVHLQNAKIYIQAQNVLTITNYKGLDPENASILRLPPLKIITVGMQIAI